MKLVKSVAVIGAGPSGLACLHALKNLKRRVVCFEKQSTIGGLWNYDHHTGIGPYGEPVHGSMYQNLWSNGPKECLEFADYSFLKHFGVVKLSSYPPRAVILDYIKGKAKRDNVEKFIRFNEAVRWVEPACMKQVKVHTHNTTELFDHVIIATGHYSTPNIPDFPGVNTFTGRIMHSHDFRSVSELRNLRVLLVGSSYRLMV